MRNEEVKRRVSVRVSMGYEIDLGKRSARKKSVKSYSDIEGRRVKKRSCFKSIHKSKIYVLRIGGAVERKY